MRSGGCEESPPRDPRHDSGSGPARFRRHSAAACGAGRPAHARGLTRLEDGEPSRLPPQTFDRHAFLAAAATTQDAYAAVVEEAWERRLAVEATLSAGRR